MTESLTGYPSISKPKFRLGSWVIYLLIGLITNAGLWIAAFLYLTLKTPTYSSDFAITLPDTRKSDRIALPSTGAAYSESQSPYAGSQQDPRENYKFIISSKSVLEQAASRLNMKPGEFGKPQIKILHNSTLMTFELRGNSPEEARNKANALYQAFEAKLAELRSKEIEKQDELLRISLGSAQTKLELAQQRLSEYKATSGLAAPEQIRELTVSIEQLRKQRAEILAQQKQAEARQNSISNNLNLSSQQAASAFNLQTDALFQKYTQAYSEANAALIDLNSKFLPQHPAVIEATEKRNLAEANLLQRATALLGRPVNQSTLQQLNLSASASPRQQLFQDLVTDETQRKGLEAQAKVLDQQITLLETRLKLLAQKESTLERLKRDLDTADAVFSSSLARLNITKTDIFATYPQIQMITEPSLSDKPTSPKKNLALLGAALGSLFITSGLVSHWLYITKAKSKAMKNKEIASQKRLIPVNSEKAEALASSRNGQSTGV